METVPETSEFCNDKLTHLRPKEVIELLCPSPLKHYFYFTGTS